MSYAPVTKRYLQLGGMSLGGICAAALRQSDNTAANLILRELGGVQGWLRFARRIGDSISRLDRYEPALNSAEIGDVRDTTTPEAIRRDVEAILASDLLTLRSRQRPIRWMHNSPLTAPLIQSGLEHPFDIYDKSGAGAHGSRGDIGLIRFPTGAEIAIAIYLTETTLTRVAQNSLIAEIARRTLRAFPPA